MRRRRLIASGLGTLAAAAGGWRASAPGARARAQTIPAAAPGGRWITVTPAPLPEAVEELFGVAVNGKMYAFQGLLPGFRPAGLVYEYDPGADAWTKKKPMARPLHHAAAVPLNGKIYTFGGFVLPDSGPPGWVPVNDTWEYDPAGDAWRPLAPMPTRRGAAAAAVVDGKVYVVGGAAPLPRDTAPLRPLQPHRSLDTVEEYDPVANRWRARAPMPTPRNHLVAEAVNNRLYAIGGRLAAAFIIAMPGNTDIVQEYNPAADRWETRAPMPTARSGCNSAVVDGRIYVAGGELQTYQYLAAFRAFEAYDPADNTWWQLPSMPAPRHEAAMAALGNRIHVAGGDVQSAIVPPPKGASFAIVAHDVFEVAP